MCTEKQHSRVFTPIFRVFLPSIYKFGLLSTLLFRYFSICSNYFLFHLEVVKLKEIFQRNGYPLGFINACIKTFLNKMFVQKISRHDVPKQEFVIILPYLGPLSNKTHKRIRSIFQQCIPWGKINLIFKTQCRISHIFKFKDAIPLKLLSSFVYSYKCPSCNSGYIGETERHSKVRWCEHLGISCFTDHPIVGIQTAVRDHIKTRKCESTLNDFKIICTEGNSFLCKVKALH